jgi:hypothetical protein
MGPRGQRFETAILPAVAEQIAGQQRIRSLNRPVARRRGAVLRCDERGERSAGQVSGRGEVLDTAWHDPVTARDPPRLRGRADACCACLCRFRRRHSIQAAGDQAEDVRSQTRFLVEQVDLGVGEQAGREEFVGQPFLVAETLDGLH